MPTQQEEIAREFALQLTDRNYKKAYRYLSKELHNKYSVGELERMFDAKCPRIYDPAENVEVWEDDLAYSPKNPNYVWVSFYYRKWGNVEGVWIDDFVFEDDSLFINNFEIGRP